MILGTSNSIKSTVMNWLLSLIFDTSSFAHGFLVYSVIISLGICLGRKKIFGLSLGATCVLFVGLIVGYAGVKVDPAMMAFFRNFGLVLFVFFIGLQVGPSFFATFQKQRVRADRLDDARCRIKPFNHYFTVFPIFQQHFPS